MPRPEKSIYFNYLLIFFIILGVKNQVFLMWNGAKDGYFWCLVHKTRLLVSCSKVPGAGHISLFWDAPKGDE
ncbi:hypothetical protein A1332_21490 [Methylomonas methanica]|uniref:Uncharacterized protein n=1 Tax=Methylomonas methanica TaxID=421 RepID=A0A177LWT4_METMH|nr:hypothetical protein A1332_21490 [Methylomonas methanica]